MSEPSLLRVTIADDPPARLDKALARDVPVEASLSRSRLAKLIDAEYRYPLTNYETYRNFVSMGGRGPSPFKWCSEYAARKVQPQYTALTASTSTK